jgi:hypothetical protein
MHIVPSADMILVGVNTVNTVTGGKIPGAMIDKFVAAINTTTSTGDTNAPTVSITSPAGGSTVAGTVYVSAQASDNVGVAGVQFLVDGKALGAEYTAAPYAVNWDTATVLNGSHTLTARARDAAGNARAASIAVTVSNAGATVDPAVTSFVLINADTDQPIAGYNPIPANAVLNLAQLPTRRLNIGAVTNPVTVGSVKFTLNGGTFRIENAAPYALAGDTNGNYYAWTPTVRSYTLAATPYSGANASGAASAPLTISFSVIDQP